MGRRNPISNIFRKPTTTVDSLKRACHLVEPQINVAEVNVPVATREVAHHGELLVPDLKC